MTGRVPSPPPPPGLPPDDGRSRAADGAPAADAGAGLGPGFVLSHTYEIERLVARGGMGEVYRARSLVDGSEVALKVIRPELAEDPRVRELFSREAGILRRIRHDAVVGYGGLLRDEQGRTFLVMDYVDGPSLAERLAAGPLSVEQVRRLKERLARGLAVVHDAGTYHRDLSPDNILLPGGDLERAVVIDFGIARIADPDVGTVIGKDFAGKLGFVSPEQLGVVDAPVDQRSDIYSLGLVLAAAAAGRPLEMGQSWGGAIAARRRVPDLDAVPAELRAELAPMLDPDPERRPRSMRALFAAEPEGAGDRDSPPPPPRPAASPVSGRALGVAAAAAVVLLGGAGGFWAYATLGPAPAERVAGGVAAALERALASSDCAEVDFALGDAPGAVELSGVVGSPEALARLTAAVRAVDGVRAVGAGGVAVSPPPLCTALAVLRRETTQPEPPAGIALTPNRPDSAYREGDFFTVTVEMPEGRPGYLYVDYLDSAGEVVHLLPNPFAPDNRHEPGATVTLGAADAAEARATGRRAYQALAPFGQSLLTAIVSPEPLFDDVRDEVEAAGDYLPALSERLAQTDAGAAPVSAARFVETKPREENARAGPAATAAVP